jgi:DNA invertase Pin-like site-specific DNA recombinase
MGHKEKRVKAVVYARFANAQDVALYCRVASADEDVLAMQERLLRAYADANGYKDDGFVEQRVYRDNGVSGLSMDRPGMNRLAEDIRAGGIRTVIVMDISRVSRNFSHTLDWLEFLKRHDVKFISIGDGVQIR